MKHLFLTGATGLVGRYLLRDLLSRQVPLAILCRPSRFESADRRVDSLIRRWEDLDGRKLPRPVILSGSLTEPGLGLDDSQMNWLSQHCDSVLHNAAAMMFREDKNHEPFRTNVDGMKNLLAVCEQAGLRQFHHVSTAYVCGLREGRMFENELDLGQQSGNVYEVSKMAAEKLVRGARFLDRLTIYRPASVVGDSVTGYTASSHGFYLPLQMAYVMADKVPPELMGERFFHLLGLTGEEGKNLVPVDWLSAAIVRLVMQPQHHGQTYHLTNPRPVSVRLIQQVIRESIEQYTDKRFVGTPTEEELRGYEALFCQYMEIYRSHWRDDPTFDRTNTDRALPDLPCPEMNHTRMMAVASYPVKQKFIFNDYNHGDDHHEAEAAPAANAAAPKATAQPAAAPVEVPPVEIPIAIVGMACKLPGANNLDEYWQMVVNGRSAIAEVPPERLDRSLYYDPRKGQRGKTYATLGGMVDSRQFDRQACPMPQDLERSVDNAHLLMCQVAAAACQQAGMDPFNLSLRNTGVYIGHAQGSDLSGKMVVGTCIEEAAQFLYEVPAFQALPTETQRAVLDGMVSDIRGQSVQRGADSPDLAIHMVAGTISKAFGLNGPFMAINSACASSLHTIQLAARALQQGHIDMAIVGGASDLKDGSLVLFANAQSMTASGSRPFDEAADGLVIAEGYVALVLKTLPRALADGDPIQGIVMGIGASSDGRGKSLWAPRKEGQVTAMERAYRNGLDMGSLQYVEAHATSTNLGDATELNSLSEVLKDRLPAGKKIPVTSVKANIGHALEAAGIAGLIKTVLCMQHRTFAPAINIRSLNSKIDWNSAPIYIPQTPEAWPEQQGNLPRRAAVNAFGIGGLNVHLVVEEFTEARREALRATWCGAKPIVPTDEDANAVAVIGMGCILPGAAGVERYWELLRSGRDPKTPVPADRWKANLFCQENTRQPYRAANSVGGFITDFAYDWKRHKVPPKQVEQADPLQFMLLDAAEQALNDAGYDKREFDRTRTAVLVGTEFNGDFGAQLAVSLRLPELERLLKRLMVERGVPADRAAEVATGFSEMMLKHWPSLIDESGSFSTSTLASRITKTMNLMGGAVSIDAGDASAAAALSTGIDLLISGDCDLLLCAGGQRSMNLPQYEALTQCGILAQGSTPSAPFDAGATGILPGEGVGMVLLKRLADARRDGDRIHTIIRGVGGAHAESQETSLRLSMQRAFEKANITPADVALVEADGTGMRERDAQHLSAIADVYATGSRRQPLAVSTVTGQIGHTGGASAMAALLKASMEMAHGELPRTVGLKTPLGVNGTSVQLVTRPQPIHPLTDDGRRIAAVSSSGKGLSYHILLEHGERTPVAPMTLASKTTAATSAVPVTTAPTAAPSPAASRGTARIYRFAGRTADELAQNVTAVLAQLPGQPIAESGQFDATSQVRLAIVANGPEMLAEKLQSFMKQRGNPAGLAALEQQGCFYRQVSARPPRVAFVFPGQGSQYPGMLRELVQDSPAAAQTMASLDALLVERGFPTFEDLAWQRPELLGSDIWSTQLAMLLANLIAHSAAIEAGIHPDLVTGHSYGEFAAITAAGAWSLASALSAARARVDGIEATAGARGTMLAVAAPAHVVEQLASALPERAYLANFNSPEQTVVGGSEESLRQLSKMLDVMGYKSQMIPVPCPFHTPLMAGSAEVLRQTLATLPIDPPRVPLLSSVTNRYVAEPDDIRENLSAQLTTPVRYLDLITRIASDRDTVFVEIGPNQALTRLNRKILEGRNVPGIIALDHPKRPGCEQMLHVRALLECVGACGAGAQPCGADVQPCGAGVQPCGAGVSPAAGVFASPPQAKPAYAPRKGSITHVDATERRRNKMRANATSPSPAKVASPANVTRAPLRSAPAVAPTPVSTPEPAVQANGHLHGPGTAKPAAGAPKLAPAPTPVAEFSEPLPKQPRRDIKELEQFLINFVVEQTGYPPEVVELDADLEADLGIDSIKKAQLFGELAEYFDVQPDEDMTLDDFPTLRHVTEFLQGAEFKKELAAEAAPQAVAPAAAPVVPPAPAPRQVAPAAPTVPAASAAASAPSTRNTAELEQFLINFVVEQTGYPPEVVELDADLEADLGIDSIKKAQLFGELAEYFDARPDENMTLDDFPTLRHVTEFLRGAECKKELVSEAAPELVVAVSAASPVMAAPVVAAPAPVYHEAPRPTVAATMAAASRSAVMEPPTSSATAAVAEPAAPGQSAAELEQFLINFVVEQTGYPPEVVELDADLEADLGIDSIKKAQLFGELAEYFDARPDENMTLDDFPTLRHVVNFLAQGDVKKKGLTEPTDPTDDLAAASGAALSPAPASDLPTAPYDLEDTSHDASLRYAMKTRPCPFPEETPAMPCWCGAAMIVGDGPAAEALARLLTRVGVPVVRLEVSDNLEETLARFEAHWNRQPIHHFFLMTAHHLPALDPADRDAWRTRRYRAVTLPFYLLQRWTQLAADAKRLDRCTLVACTSLGGDLGFSGQVTAPEGGAMTGLMKAIYIEYNVFRKFEAFLAKAVDSPDDENPDQLAANICRELASRMADYEVAFVGNVRQVQTAYVRPPQPRQFANIRPGGAWVFTGGARGITALCAMELGRRYDLQVHLLGSSPLPDIKPEWRSLDESGLKTLQATVMREARVNRQSMDDAWARVRKDLEIDRNLADLKAAGLKVWYHQCDVGDEAAVARVLDEIRRTSGPIEGILHGAGVERSCNYERKKPEVFEATLATKADGALNLMRLTSQDPLRYFVGFGSISGRLGSNGQTDYCLASDLLVKLSAWHRTWRPEVRSVGMHWHPWSDVGMAASPEVAKLLKLTNGPVPMDKAEGVRHLLRELYAADTDTEILITDEEFCGRFYGVPHPPRPLPPGETVGIVEAADTVGSIAEAEPADNVVEIASRHQLRLADAPLPSGSQSTPLVGAACILGDNPAARALRDRLTQMQVPVELVPATGTEAEVLAGIDKAYAQSRFQHFFLMTGRDAVSDPLGQWFARRAQGVTHPYRATQQWLRLRRKAKDTSPSTISAATSLGGDFGIAGKISVPDSGALCGLLKSLHLEDSRKPQSELRTKVLDFPTDEAPAAIADALLQELTHDDPNVEVAWSNGRRQVVRSFPQPADTLLRRPIERGSVWIVTGGARGITASTALELGKRYGLKLHLLGRTPAPQPDAIWRNYNDQQLVELKAQIVARAVAEGRSPEADWDRVRHDREIHESLEKFIAAGVNFTYHSCDVANPQQLAEVLDRVRRTDGRIDGILHGAGWARPGRFDSRSHQIVEKTFTGKLDGAINLMALTAGDPIRYWVGYGSISGRYGGNGLSDYAAANDMLAKLTAWYRQQRPECAACCFHWQSWDEVGMSIHSDSSTVGAKGVLKMEFISPREGNRHLCRELEAGLPTSETLITDGYFEQIFYPHIQAENDGPKASASKLASRFAMVDSTTRLEGAPGILAHIQFDPDKDPFLYDHTLRGKPLLPAVAGMEAMAEAAALLAGKQVVALRQVEFQTGLPFQPGRPIAARVRAERINPGTISCQLLTDFRNRAGQIVQPNRVHFVCLADVADTLPPLRATYSNPTTDWHPFQFRTDGLMVHGPTFQGVKRVTFAEDMCWGELTALSLGNLGGAHRPNHWLVPATLVDAAFYVCSIHLWLHVEPVPALPQSIESLRLGRMPQADEPVWVQGRFRAVQDGHAIYDFTLFDQQRVPIVQVDGFRCVMIKANTGAALHA